MPQLIMDRPWHYHNELKRQIDKVEGNVFIITNHLLQLLKVSAVLETF